MCNKVIMKMTTIIITTLTVAGGAGAWKFYEFLIRNKREKEKETMSQMTWGLIFEAILEIFF